MQVAQAPQIGRLRTSEARTFCTLLAKAPTLAWLVTLLAAWFAAWAWRETVSVALLSTLTRPVRGQCQRRARWP